MLKDQFAYIFDCSVTLFTKRIIPLHEFSQSPSLIILPIINTTKSATHLGPQTSEPAQSFFRSTVDANKRILPSVTLQASQSRCLSLQKWDKSHTCGCHTSDRSDIFHSSNPSPFHLWCVGSRFLLITACRFTSLEHITLTYDDYVCGFRPHRFVTMW